jgi:hypothetical protein
MFKEVLLGLSACILIVCSASSGLSQKLIDPKAPSTMTYPPYSVGEFSGVVGPHFQGNNLTELVENRARSLDPQQVHLELLIGEDSGEESKKNITVPGKGEFETSAQYADRLRQSPQLSSGVPHDPVFAFVFPTDRQMNEGTSR